MRCVTRCHSDNLLIECATDSNSLVVAAIRPLPETIAPLTTEPETLWGAITRVEAQVLLLRLLVTPTLEQLHTEMAQLTIDVRNVAILLNRLEMTRPELTATREPPSSDEPSLFFLTSVAGPGGKLAPATSQLLTRRESEVIRLLARGLTDKEIAAAIGLSRRTASGHVATILDKLEVNTRTAAVSRAFQLGLIGADEDKRTA